MAQKPSRRARLRRWLAAEREARVLRWRLVAMLPAISPWLSAAVAGMVVLPAALLTATTVATGVLVGAVPAAVQGGFDSAAGHRLVAALIAMCLLFAAQEVTNPLADVFLPSLRLRVDLALRTRLMRATLRPPGIAHLESPEVLDRIRDAQGLATGQSTPGMAVEGLMGNARQRLSGVGGAVLVGLFHWWLGLGLLLVSIALRQVMLRDIRSKGWVGAGSTAVMRRSDYFRDLAVTPEAAKELRVFGLGQWVTQRFRQHWQQGMGVVWRERDQTRTPITSWAVPWGLTLVGAQVLVGWAAVHGEISLQTLAMTSSAVITAAGIWIGSGDAQVAFGVAALGPLFEVEALTRQADEARAASGVPDPPRTAIRFEGVRFRYPGRDHDVFTDLDIAIPAGRSLAIVGLNGAGKTTLIKLLAKLYDPDAGRITVDGADLRDIDAEAWRRHLAAIFQDYVRYPLDLRSNVGFGAAERIDDTAAVHAALGKVGLADLAGSLPAGLDTVLSRAYTDGTDLSGGQWQRVALARALFGVAAGASVLVLDEPTANLDVRAEAELFDQFLELTRGLTTILVSHRFSSVRHADRICVLQDGRVVEQGTHDELVHAGGNYATMFALQASRFTTDVQETHAEPVP